MSILWNKPIHHLKTTIWIYVALAALFSPILLFYFFQKPIQSTAPRPKAQRQILGIEAQNKNQTLPLRLKIPTINVDTAIEYVGIAPDGSMEAPNNTVNVGWFRLGPRPGEKGNAVIDGHFDGPSGEPGVFAYLDKLKPDDKLYIENDNGTSITFVVREIRLYDPGYAEEVFSSNGGIHLNLVTCDGVWDSTKKSYSKRLVVFTDIAQ